MAKDPQPAHSNTADATPAKEKRASKADKGDIPSGLSYVNATGVLSKILKKIIDAPAPEKITQDFLANVWGFTGGSAMAVIPFLKKIDFLSSDGAPTEAYRKFRTNNLRNEAIRHGLHKGFADIYRQTDFAESAKEEKILDILVGITGRARNDGTVKAIMGSFKALTSLMTSKELESTPSDNATSDVLEEPVSDTHNSGSGFNLGYQINIILPETKDVEVFDAIFRKLKEHLL